MAVGIGLVAALYLSLGAGRIPWIALALAVTFALYGLLKKRLGATLPALHGLAVETTVLLPVAVGLVIWLGVTGEADLHDRGSACTPRSSSCPASSRRRRCCCSPRPPGEFPS